VPILSGTTVIGYNPTIISNSDYSPFGVELDGRTSVGSYRYGFNGMEADDEAKGDGNSYNFGARMYDARLGRFLSIDPRFKDFPKISTYCYAANSPILYIDINGEGPINPLTGLASTVTAWSVSDWEVFDYDSEPKKPKFNDMNLFRSASWNREGMEDETSWGDDYPTYNKRIFVGKAKNYEATLYKNAGLNEKTNGLMRNARTSENFLSHQSNFKRLEKASLSGNYIYGQESENKYTITTVKDHWIKEQANFIEGSDGNWNIESIIHYDVTNYKITEDFQTVDCRDGTTSTIKNTTITYDLKTTTTTFDKSGKETVKTSNEKITTKI
jgi:RHS repeat-associated protein